MIRRKPAFRQGYLAGSFLLFLGLFAFILASCGSAPDAGTGAPNPATPSTAVTPNTTVILQPLPTHTAVTPTPATTVPGTIVPGKVLVTLSQSRYTSGEKIVATISNGLSIPLSVRDHQTACTVLTLERQTDGGWLKQANCRLMTVTRLITIPAHGSLTQILQGGGTSSQWPAGAYRLLLDYAGDHQAAFTPAYSAIFVIA